MDLVTLTYRATRGFPREEIYGLTSQLRRAAVSIPSNIAEGQGRTSRKEFLSFLSIAHGSLCEVETQVEIAHRLGYLDERRSDKLNALSSEVGRLVQGLMKTLKN